MYGQARRGGRHRGRPGRRPVLQRGGRHREHPVLQLLANNTDRTLSHYYNADCANLIDIPAPGRAVAYANPLSVRIIA
ncbi:hypothetical protein ACFY2V_00040 [Streptomyces eurythermus]|uniref:hypothetical protein n=1 Tax=Streptomyces eurythermus TaxID=42237 RepID=UPI0036899FC0